MAVEIHKDKFSGAGGVLEIAPEDELTRKLAMLIEGECSLRDLTSVAKSFGFSRPRYFQLRAAFLDRGSLGLRSLKRGPKTHYRRTGEVLCQVIRHRFLDPEASSEVIAQKLRQCGFLISKRSVDRIFAQFGLQKKTIRLSPKPQADRNPDLSNSTRSPHRTGRSS
jgi:hypothetical protein